METQDIGGLEVAVSGSRFGTDRVVIVSHVESLG